MTETYIDTDFLIIGSGIAGLTCAIKAADFGDIIIVTKKKAAESNTNYAQGGIACVFNSNDTKEQHIIDTLKAGDYHNNREAVELLINESKDAIMELISYGMGFEKMDDGHFRLAREGGHSYNRILYYRDKTGQAVESILLEKVKSISNIELIENCQALDIIKSGNTCNGAYVLKKEIITIFSKATVLSTGGIGRVYKITTNPEIATGDGIGIGYRAGAILSDMEFIQFHPTVFIKKDGTTFLISETVRGEGARLINSDGEPFMKKYHPLGDLAPRNIVSYAIYLEQKRGNVYLDMTHKSEDEIEKRFPTIYRVLMENGYNLSETPVPVTPAAHYLCGGISVDLYGRTTIKNLYAYGETACTGVHGANRLASNSLLESIVFSRRIALIADKIVKNKIEHTTNNPKYYNIPEPDDKKNKEIAEKVRNIMWNHAGIVRKEKDMKKGLLFLRAIEKEYNAYNKDTAPTEVLNMIQTGLSILNAAIKRKKSLGCHYII